MVGKRGVIGVGKQNQSIPSTNTGWTANQSAGGMVSQDSRVQHYSSMRATASWGFAGWYGNIMSEGGEDDPESVCLSSNGEHLYVMDYQKIHHFKLSTPYDISTKTYLYEYNFDTGDHSHSNWSCMWSPDGQYLQIGSYSPDFIFQYKTSTPWYIRDPSSNYGTTILGRAGNAKFTLLYSTSNITGYSRDQEALYISPDGTKMFTVCDYYAKISQWTLTTAHDPTTKTSAVDFNFNATTEGHLGYAPMSIDFSPDGSKMYLMEIQDEQLHRFDLNTAFDLSGTVTYNSKRQFTGAAIRGFAFSPDGTKFLYGNDSGYVGVYTVATAWDVESTFTYVDSVRPTIRDIEGVSWNSDGTQIAACDNYDDRVWWYNLTTAYDITTAGSANYFDTHEKSMLIYGVKDVHFGGPNGDDYLWIADNNNASYRKSAFRGELAIPGDIKSFDTGWFLGNTLNDDPTSMQWSSDGRKLYICDHYRDKVYQYNAEDWAPDYFMNHKTPVYYGTASITSGEPRGIAIMPNGKDVYIADSSADDIRHYVMSTPWDITTLSYSGSGYDRIEIYGYDSHVKDLFVDSGGRQMLLVGNNDHDLVEWRMNFS